MDWALTFERCLALTKFSKKKKPNCQNLMKIQDNFIFHAYLNKSSFKSMQALMLKL